MKRSAVLVMMIGAVFAGARQSDAQSCAPSVDHGAAIAIRRLANVLYEPFAQYPFKPGGVCIDPGLFQVLADAYFRTPDGSAAPQIEALCLNRPEEGELQIRWSFGPTPQGQLLLDSGAEDEEYVRTHDFWHVGVPTKLACSQSMQLRQLILERDGGIDVHIGGDDALIRIYGVSMDLSIPGSKIPRFLLDDIGVDALSVNAKDQFVAKLSAPLLNFPISTIGDIGPHDGLSLDVLGVHFKLR